jgi:hypothetical protein
VVSVERAVVPAEARAVVPAEAQVAVRVVVRALAVGPLDWDRSFLTKHHSARDTNHYPH